MRPRGPAPSRRCRSPASASSVTSDAARARPSRAPCASSRARRRRPSRRGSTSPPWASVSLSAASSAYSSLALTTAGDGRAVEPPVVRAETLAARRGVRHGLDEDDDSHGRAASVDAVAAVAAVESAGGERPGDDQALDLLGSLVELGDLGVAHHPLDRELVDVAVAAEHLDGVRRHAHRGVAGDEFTHRRPAAGVRRPGVDLGRGLVQELARGLGLGVHVGEHRRDHLELGDRLAELLALRGVGRGDVERALGDPDGLGGDPGPAPIERPHRDREAVAHLADAVRVGHADAVGSRARRSASRGCPSCARPARRVKPGMSFSTMKQVRRWWRGVSARPVSSAVTAKTAIRSATLPWLMKRFAPSMIQSVAVAVAAGARPGRGDVASRPRPRSARRRSASGRRRGPGTSAPSARRVPARRSGSDASSWTARIRPLVAQTRLICSIARQTVSRSPPSPPYSLRERQAQDVVAGEQLLDVPRELGGPVDLGGARRDPLVGEDRGRRRAGRAGRRSGGRSGSGRAAGRRERLGSDGRRAGACGGDAS